MKKNMIFSGAMSMMTALLLCTACSSDDVTTDKATAAVPEGKVIHYTATVGEGDETRATLNSSKKYEFQSGDKLVITGTDISGELTLATGAGTASATFSGNLTYTGEGTPADDLVLKAVLVSESNAMTKLEYDEATYPTTAIASTLADAVQKYSHFTATSTYADKEFKVSQQTSFLNFTVTFGEGTSSSGALDITIKNGSETVRTGSVTAATGGSNAVAQFVAAMPAGTTMSSATVQLGSNSAISFGGTTTLVANKIYNISKNVGRFAVDLGLPSGTKWANMNVGATSETEYGDYFAWGETEPYYSSQDPLTWKDGKTNGYADDWSSYKWCNGSYNTMTKYNNDEDYGTVDGKLTLEADDDAATANWGGDWRMPTYDELEELARTCPQYGGSKEKISGYSWEWQSDYQGSGHAGYLITVTKECAQKGNSIFLPAAGYGENELLDWQGDCGFYWSSTLNENVRCAWCPNFGSDEVYMGSDLYRYYGCTVRPVQSN